MLCGILFKTNFNKKTNKPLFEESLELLNHRGPDEFGILYNDLYSFGHKRLSIRDLKNGKQPMSILNTHLIYNGEIYNYDELKEYYNESLESSSDTLLLLKLLNKYNISCLDKINGIFSFVYTKDDEVLICRDMFGVKPLYYSYIDNDIIVSSELKAILNYKQEVIVNKEGLQELLGMGPSHSIGKTVYKGIYELEPGYYLYGNKEGFKKRRYYSLKAKKHLKNYNDTVNEVKELVIKAIKRQTISDVGYSCLLSGGLDSSIIATVLSDITKLSTYSIDYENNRYFNNGFEISKDDDYVSLVSSNIGSEHQKIIISDELLIKYLEKVVCIKDYPGMTDIDSSMYYLTKQIAKDNKVAFSGECADEIFAGYPWFYQKHNVEGFPWINNLDFKENLLKEEIKDLLNLKDYVYNEYYKGVNEADILEDDTKLNNDKRKLMYLNMYYFMANLLDRKDRLSMASSLEVRVPFCDKDLVEYLYNVPFKYKYRMKKEKKLLRDAFKGKVIDEVINRKKSPYPKSNSSLYEEKIKSLFLNMLANSDSKIFMIFDKEKLATLANETEFDVPWYGQLMRKTSLMAYIYQMEYWINKYNVRFEI